MDLLHACWLADERVFLWAEDRRRALTHRRAPPRDRRDQDGVAPHPWALSRRRLETLLGYDCPRSLPALEPALGCLELPRRQGWPGTGFSPPPPDEPPSPEEPRGRFEVEGFVLPPGLLLVLAGELLEAAWNGGEPDLAFLGLLPGVALRLFARGAVLPGWGELPDGDALGVWRSVLGAPAEQALLEGLAVGAPRSLWACCGVRPDRRRRWSEFLVVPPTPRHGISRMLAHLVATLAPAMLAEVAPPRARGPLARWVRSLLDPERTVGPKAAELREWAGQIQAWVRARRDPIGAGARPVLRLLQSDEGWRVRFLARVPEGLEIPPEPLAAWLRSQRAELAALMPSLGGEELEIPVLPERAAMLLEGGADFLAQLGWDLEVPEAWLRRRLARRAVLRPAGEGAGPGLGLEALCRVDWQVLHGGEPLTRAELAALAASRGRLVQVGSRWVLLDAAQREALARHLEETAPDGEGPPSPLVEGLRRALGLSSAGPGLETEELVGEGWLASLLGEGAGGPRGRYTPRRFQGKLRDYQRRGLTWLSHLEEHGLGACLADDMGLGKTVQVLALLAAEKPARSRCTLLVAPLSVLGNWAREAARFVPDLRVHVYHGPGRGDAEDLARMTRDHDLVLTTYGVLARNAEALAAVGWHRVVLDEAQAIKNPGTRAARAARSLPATRRLALTGTPVENHLLELWSIMHFLNPGLLGTQADFRRSFAAPIEKRGDQGRLAALRRLVGPFLLRRKKTDPGLLPELPEKIATRRDCQLTREQARLYRAATEEALAELEQAEGMARRGKVLALITRLKKICNHPEHLLGAGGPLEGRSGKLAELDALLELLEENQERALCFTQYRGMGELLRAHLEARYGQAPAFLHGGVSRAGRERMVDAFQAGEGPPVLLVSLKAGGTGLNLTAASHVIHFDRWWNPAVEDQATDRAHRIGQRRNVQVHKLVTLGTLEERIDETLEAKRELAEAAVAGGEAWITELSTAELRELLSLTGPEGRRGGP